MHVVESKGYERNILGIASSPVLRGAARPSAASPWPVCLLRPRSAADALALACLSPYGLWTYFCWWCRRARCLGHTARWRAAVKRSWLDHTHREQRNQSSHRNFINFILRWAARESTQAELAKEIGQLYVAIRLQWAGSSALLSPMSVSFLFIIILPAKRNRDGTLILVIHEFLHDRSKYLTTVCVYSQGWLQMAQSTCGQTEHLKISTWSHDKEKKRHRRVSTWFPPKDGDTASSIVSSVWRDL